MNPIVKLMGIIDLGLVCLLLFSAIFPEQWLTHAGTYLVFKGGLFAFLGDIFSYLDVGIGIYFFIMGFGVSSAIISVIAMLFLVQKGLASLF